MFAESHTVRWHVDEGGIVWWVAQDVGAILDIAEVRSTLRHFDADEKGVHTVDTPGGPQRLLTVNEPGLYRLIFLSRKPAAHAFKRWVTHEVLPQIRRTGTYTAPGARTRPLGDAPHEFTVSQVLCFWEVYTHPQQWYTTETLARAAQISVRRVRDYCRVFADLGIFERVHWHPLKQYRWHEQATAQGPALVQAYVRAYGMLPRDLPQRGVFPWERENDPTKW
jgi:hypothetical protein